MRVLSCLSDMADKRVANSFQNRDYKDKLSKVIKLFDRWVMKTIAALNWGT